jgi:hypothetical protein
MPAAHVVGRLDDLLDAAAREDHQARLPATVGVTGLDRAAETAPEDLPSRGREPRLELAVAAFRAHGHKLGRANRRCHRFRRG